MFLTDADALIASLDPSTAVWSHVEPGMHAPILFVEAGTPRDEPELTKLFLTYPGGLTGLEASHDVSIRKVLLLSPEAVNEWGGWRLNQLLELWECEQPLSWEFSVRNGAEVETYRFSQTGAETGELKRARLIYQSSEASERVDAALEALPAAPSMPKPSGLESADLNARLLYESPDRRIRALIETRRFLHDLYTDGDGWPQAAAHRLLARGFPSEEEIKSLREVFARQYASVKATLEESGQ